MTTNKTELHHEYDNLSPEDAVIQAWSMSGTSIIHHIRMQEIVRKQLPALAKALDRMLWDSVDIIKPKCEDIWHGKNQICGPNCKWKRK